MSTNRNANAEYSSWNDLREMQSNFPPELQCEFIAICDQVAGGPDKPLEHLQRLEVVKKARDWLLAHGWTEADEESETEKK
jgi:hypothetical protein